MLRVYGLKVGTLSLRTVKRGDLLHEKFSVGFETGES